MQTPVTPCARGCRQVTTESSAEQRSVLIGRTFTARRAPGVEESGTRFLRLRARVLGEELQAHPIERLGEFPEIHVTAGQRPELCARDAGGDLARELRRHEAVALAGADEGRARDAFQTVERVVRGHGLALAHEAGQ